MTGPVFQLSVAKNGVDEVGAFDGNIEDLPFPGGLVVCGGRFVKMAEVIELVAQVVHLFPTVFANPFVPVFAHDGAVGKQVTVVFLRFTNQINKRIDFGFERRIGEHLERVGGPFNNFVDVGVVERVRRTKHALFQTPGNGEVFNTAGFVAFLNGDGDGHIVVGTNPFGPEIVGYLHAGKRHGRNGIFADDRFFFGTREKEDNKR